MCTTDWNMLEESIEVDSNVRFTEIESEDTESNLLRTITGPYPGGPCILSYWVNDITNSDSTSKVLLRMEKCNGECYFIKNCTEGIRSFHCCFYFFILPLWVCSRYSHSRKNHHNSIFHMCYFSNYVFLSGLTEISGNQTYTMYFILKHYFIALDPFAFANLLSPEQMPSVLLQALCFFLVAVFFGAALNILIKPDTIKYAQ